MKVITRISTEVAATQAPLNFLFYQQSQECGHEVRDGASHYIYRAEWACEEVSNEYPKSQADDRWQPEQDGEWEERIRHPDLDGPLNPPSPRHLVNTLRRFTRSSS